MLQPYSTVHLLCLNRDITILLWSKAHRFYLSGIGHPSLLLTQHLIIEIHLSRLDYLEYQDKTLLVSSWRDPNKEF